MVNYKLKEKVYEANMDQMLTMGKDKILNLPGGERRLMFGYPVTFINGNMFMATQ